MWFFFKTHNRNKKTHSAPVPAVTNEALDGPTELLSDPVEAETFLVEEDITFLATDHVLPLHLMEE